MFVTIINDCRDQNVQARQETRAIALFNRPVSFVGVKNDIEAAGNLIDTIAGADNNEGIFLVNVAPRSKKAWWLTNTKGDFTQKKGNGSPFCYFTYNKMLIISTVQGLTLSLVKKFKLTDKINIIDAVSLQEKIDKMTKAKKEKYQINTQSQFRSLDVSPYVARMLLDKETVPSKEFSINTITMPGNVVWFVDNFGNCKTTMLKKDLDKFKKGKLVNSKIGKIPFYNQLKDVPEDKTAFVEGSSGLKGQNFIELVIQGGNASRRYNLYSGENLFKE
jgi:hypothetical protein